MDSTWFDAHGFVFAVSSDNPEVIHTFDDLLADMALADGALADGALADGALAARHRYVVSRPEPADGSPADSAPRFEVRLEPTGETVYQTLSAGTLVSHLLIDVNRRAAETAGRTGAVPVHAGCVTGPTGAIVLPGASHSGKTTLTAALALHGFDFVADEVTLLDPLTNTVRPYGKPVALRPASVTLLADRVERLSRVGSPFEVNERFVPPHELSELAHGPSPIAAVVFPRFGAEPHAATGDDSGTEMQPLTPGQALERLMHSVLVQSNITAATFRALEHLSRSTPAYEIHHRHVDDAVAKILRIPSVNAAQSVQPDLTETP